MMAFSGYDALSFDCYGTLIDWETGIAAALRPWADRSGLSLDDDDLVAAHARHETVVQQETPTTPYPAILAETARRIGRDYGHALTEEETGAYSASVGEWPAFSDSALALAELKQRYKLIILSNVDRASFARSAERLGVEFDLVVTAEDVGSYKPDLANFAYLFERVAEIGVRRERLLHVAESLYHDHEPAHRVGLESVWIHRRHHRGGWGATAAPSGVVEPRWRFTSLEEFAHTTRG